jgi:hypothetical protein
MSNWYKKAALGNDLTTVISTWLRNARNHPEVANTHDDISHQMQGADNGEQLSAAISAAIGMVTREQGGILTPSQQELIQHLQARNQDQPVSQDPLAMPMDQQEQNFPVENGNDSFAPQAQL